MTACIHLFLGISLKENMIITLGHMCTHTLFPILKYFLTLFLAGSQDLIIFKKDKHFLCSLPVSTTLWHAKQPMRKMRRWLRCNTVKKVLLGPLQRRRFAHFFLQEVLGTNYPEV